MAKRAINAGIDLSALSVQKTPRSAREVADKKLRQELRAAGDQGASKKTGVERDEDLANYYKQRAAEKAEAAKAAKQKQLLADPTQSLIECACAGASRLDDLAFLIERGVDLDDLGPSDASPLMHACRFGATSQPGLEALVRAGATVDLRNSTGATALMVAVNNANASAVSFLLDHSGADPALVDSANHSALQCAYERGNAAIASKILRALSMPPARVTTVAREKQMEAKKKALAARRKEMEEKQAARDKKIAEAMAEP